MCQSPYSELYFFLAFLPTLFSPGARRPGGEEDGEGTYKSAGFAAGGGKGRLALLRQLRKVFWGRHLRIRLLAIVTAEELLSRKFDDSGLSDRYPCSVLRPVPLPHPPSRRPGG